MVGVGDVVTMGVGAPGHPFSCGPACKYASKGRLFFFGAKNWGGGGVWGGDNLHQAISFFWGWFQKEGDATMSVCHVVNLNLAKLRLKFKHA